MADFRKKINVSLDGPKNPLDNKPIFTTSPSTEGYNTKFQGRGDDFENGIRGLGPKMAVTFDGYEEPISGGMDDGMYEKIQEFGFIEPIEINDGHISWTDDFSINDEVELYIKIGATQVTSTPGVGNVNVFSHVIVPTAGDGYYTIDLNNAVPVPASDANGFWDVDFITGVITPNVTGTGKYHLLDIQVSNQYLIDRISLFHKINVFDVDPYKAEWVHQNWIVVLRVISKEPIGSVSGWMMIFRRELGR